MAIFGESNNFATYFRMKSLTGKIARLIVFAGVAWGANAQSLDQAKKLYNDGQYEEAKPAFERLVTQSPNNSSYNLWYGVCCYETGDVGTAEKHLLVANKRKAAESYRYLALLYTDTYRFDEAVPMWEDYIALLAKKKADTEPYETLLESTERMLRMRNNTELVQIIDSIVVDKEELLSAYFLHEDNGQILPYDNVFPASGENASPVYVSPKGDQAYYGRKKNGAFALFTQSKLMDDWADEKPIFPNDSADNNYPFVLGDGRTLYFASKGNGSIGGYDLFITRYSIDGSSYLSPEQLSMPFNSPANDYMMVVDEAKGLGWFASDRNQPEGKVCLYLFIPDPARKRVSEEIETEKLRRLAALTSIKDTWVEGRNYTALITSAKTESASREKKVEKEIEFIVNDRTVYYRWSEIRSADAKIFYEKVMELKKQIGALEKRLSDDYTAYTKGNQAVRTKLKPVILGNEQKLDELHKQVKEWEKKARNAENNTLKK